MKKFIAIFLALCLCLGLSACSLGDLQSGIGNSDGEMNSANNFGGLLGGLGKEKPEEKYAELLEMLENEEYENAIMYIMMLSESGYVEIDPDGIDINISTMPVEGSDAVENEISDAARWTYDSITYGLDNYDGNGYFSYYDDIQGTSFSGSEGLANAYAFLQEYSYYESAEEYLARFSVVSDVLLKKTETSYDHLGNSSTDEYYEEYAYDSEGRLIWANYAGSDNRYGNWYDEFTYEYGEGGNVSSVKIGWSDTDMLILPYYENGNVISEEVRCADGDVFYVFYYYDEAGTLSAWGVERDGYLYSNTYTYDVYGNVTEELYLVSYYDSWYGEYTLEDAYAKTYTYDSFGTLVGMSYSAQENYNDYYGYYYQTYNNNHDYACDDQGRVIYEYITYGDYCYGSDGSTSVQSTVASEINYIYGDYYIFN